MPNKLTTDEFIKRAKCVHGNKYNYSNVTYINAITKVKIKCLIHGEFSQLPYIHLKGCGCTKCNNNKKRITRDEFIKKAMKIHGNKYDYSQVEYKGAHKKIKIICPKHGEFEQFANFHIRGHGCLQCSIKKRSYLRTKTLKNFIRDAIKIHKNKYDYSASIYKNSATKIKILCKKHGVFEQRPADHLKGCGCPKCKSSKGEIKIFNILIKNNVNFKPQHRFKECKKRLFFDFYITDAKCCFEINGIQHFKPIGVFGGTESFKKGQKRDLAKEIFCVLHKLPLIIFWETGEKTNKWNFVDLFNDSPKKILKMLTNNGFLQKSKDNYNDFKLSFK